MIYVASGRWSYICSYKMFFMVYHFPFKWYHFVLLIIWSVINRIYSTQYPGPGFVIFFLNIYDDGMDVKINQKLLYYLFLTSWDFISHWASFQWSGSNGFIVCIQFSLAFCLPFYNWSLLTRRDIIWQKEKGLLGECAKNMSWENIPVLPQIFHWFIFYH